MSSVYEIESEFPWNNEKPKDISKKFENNSESITSRNKYHKIINITWAWAVCHARTGLPVASYPQPIDTILLWTIRELTQRNKFWYALSKQPNEWFEPHFRCRWNARAERMWLRDQTIAVDKQPTINSPMKWQLIAAVYKL